VSVRHWSHDEIGGNMEDKAAHLPEPLLDVPAASTSMPAREKVRGRTGKDGKNMASHKSAPRRGHSKRLRRGDAA
jgi:hypothetical protein